MLATQMHTIFFDLENFPEGLKLGALSPLPCHNATVDVGLFECMSISYDVVRQVAPSYGPSMYGQPLQPQAQRSSVADMFVAGDFTTAAQRLQSSKMFDFDMRGYLGSVRQQPLPGMIV